MRCLTNYPHLLKSLTHIIVAFSLLAACLLATPLSAQKQEEKQDTISKYERANAEYLFIEAQKFFLLEDYERAQAFLDQSLEIDKNNGAAYFKKAEIGLITEKYDQGIAAIEMAINLEGTNKYYYILAARLHKANNDLPSTARKYELMVANTTGYKEYLLDMVDVYVELEDYEKALSTLELTEQQFDSPGKFAFQKKDLLLALGRTAEAIDQLRQLLDAGQYTAETLEQYSALMILDGKEQEAISFLAAQVAEQPTVVPVLTTLYLKNGQTDLAQPMVSKALSAGTLGNTEALNLVEGLLKLENAESLPVSQQVLEQLLKQQADNTRALELQSQLLTRMSASGEANANMEGEAIALLLKLKEKDPSDYTVWKRILTYEYEQERWKELLKQSEESLDYFPNQGLFYFYYATGSLYAGDPDEVGDLLDQSLRLSASNDSLKSRIYGKRAELALAMDDLEAAKAHFEQAIALLKLPEVVNNYVFQLALRKSDLEAAVALANELSTDYPDQLRFIRTKAFTLFQSARYAQARQTLEEGLQNLPGQDNGRTRELYGDILIKLDLVDEAVAEWQKAKTLGNTSEKLDQKIANKQYFD